MRVDAYKELFDSLGFATTPELFSEGVKKFLFLLVLRDINVSNLPEILFTSQ